MSAEDARSDSDVDDDDDSSSGLDSPISPSPIREEPPTRPTSNLQTSSTSYMTSSSTPLGNVNAARRPIAQSTLSGSGGLPSDLQSRMRQFHLTRQGAPPARSNPLNIGQSHSAGPGSPASPVARGVGGVPSNFVLPPGMSRPTIPTYNSSPAVAARGPPAQPSLAQKRGLALPGGPMRGPSPASPVPGGPKKKPTMTLSQMGGGAPGSSADSNGASSLLDKYAHIIDKQTGTLNLKGATLSNRGIIFPDRTGKGGKTVAKEYNISLDEVDTLDELGKGNYGTVYKVRHSRPRMRRPGLGLAGNKAPPGFQDLSPVSAGGHGSGETSGMIMGMKEIRLELDDAKFAAIIMELDILHRCVSPYIIDFYGAFFQEGAVYICIEFMDGGSIDKLYAGGISENILRKIAYATTMGLKSLKDEHNIIHRDVKPTNILVNTRGQVKICDFGVSGNLVASIAKTNIGCQSYMAPERISSGGVAQAGANPGGGTYSVQSDIWSLGLTIIECALGQYPYPPETYDNIFSQLSAIVDGAPPDLPADGFSEAARDFVAGCLMKIPKLRPTYAMLLQHAWLAPLAKPATISEADEEAAEAAAEAGQDMETPGGLAVSGQGTEDAEVAEWVKGALERRKNGAGGKTVQPALHAAPLDAVNSPLKQESAAAAASLTGA